jgi:hypothetical protein
VRIDQAKLKAQIKRLTLFAIIAGMMKHNIAIDESMIFNNPGLPKLVGTVFIPVKVVLMEGI